jgi:hypothetical protein
MMTNGDRLIIDIYTYAPAAADAALRKLEVSGELAELERVSDSGDGRDSPQWECKPTYPHRVREVANSVKSAIHSAYPIPPAVTITHLYEETCGCCGRSDECEHIVLDERGFVPSPEEKAIYEFMMAVD